MDRRSFLRVGAGTAAGSLALGPSFWRQALAATARAGTSPYGPLQAPDQNGILLPAGFTSREIARSGLPVAGTLHLWHLGPDGGATFPVSDGGWVYVSNSEVPAVGGASAVAFRPDGTIRDAYRILTGTSLNCAGGPTPWGTWLSCEEHERGLVWECDPTGASQGTSRPALGAFSHEAAAVDPVGGQVYLTEDRPDGRLYRFTPLREDGDDMQICILTKEREVAVFLQIVGHEVAGVRGEITGPAFTPQGDRLYFSSQRGTDGQGITYEVAGPFRS